MDLGEVLIVAGIGCRKGVSGEAVVAAIEAALARDAVARGDLLALATAELKRAEAGIAEAGQRLGLPLLVVVDAALRAAAGGALTRSGRVEAIAGVPSVSECAALAAAGDGARLLGPRLVLGAVTCALAKGGARP